MAVSKQDVIDFISNMTVLELSELIKELEDKFGVSAAAPVAMAAAPAAGGDAGAAAEEKTEFDVILVTALATRRSGLSKRFAPSPLLVSRKQKIWSKAHPARSRKAFPRMRLPTSRPRSRLPAEL